jgi:hypothetical protein
MSLLQDVRCRLRMHHWGPPIGDDWGAHQVCSYCGRSRRIGIDRPPEAHDNLGLHT